MGRGEEDGMGGVRPHLGLRVLTLGRGQAGPANTAATDVVVMMHCDQFS